MSDIDHNPGLPAEPPAVAGRGRPARGSAWLAAAGALTVLHFLWLGAHLAPAIMSPDANGYVVQARLIAEQGRTSFSTESPLQYVGMHWLETSDGVFHSRYPAGLPLLMAGAWKLGGLTAALWINPLLASATVLLVFLLARRFAPDPCALLAAAAVATVPITNQHALDADAHVAAAFFLVGGVLALLRFGETRGRLTGLLAGALLGAVPTIRYPEAIVGLAIAGWLLWRVRPVGQAWPAVIGALLPLGALGVHNAAAYGAFWRTGYALTNEQTGFGLGYFWGHVLPYLQGLGGQGIALMFAFGAAGLAALATDPRRRGEGLLFAGMVVPLVLLYMAYYFGAGGLGGAGGNLRFLIPTFPFFAVAAAWLLARLVEQLGRVGWAAVIAVASLQLIVGVGASFQTLSSTRQTLAAAARTRAVAEKEVPGGSVLIVDRQLAESLDAVGRWRLVEENMVVGLGAPGMAGPGGFGMPGGGPLPGGPGGRGGMFPPMGGGPERNGAGFAEDDPSPMQRGKNRAQQERYAGLRPNDRRLRAWSDLRTWAGDRPVFWITRSLDTVDNTLPDGADTRGIAELDAPMMAGPGGGGPMPGTPGLPGRGGMVAPGRGFAGPGGAGPMAGPRLTGGLPAGRRGAAGGAAAKLHLVQIVWPKR